MINIGFSGDLCISGSFLSNLKAGKELFNKELISEIRSCDFFVTNFEGAATEDKNLLRNDVRVVNPPESVSYLISRSINVFNLANNHIFDCGTSGFIQTRDLILNNKGYYFGSGENIDEASRIQYLEKDGVRIALIGIAHKEGMIAGTAEAGVFCDYQLSRLKKAIREAKKSADWLILNYHGGEEYSVYPSLLKRKTLSKISKIGGVDVIISHHPHVLQGFEKIGGTYVFYSLGNFVFDLSLHSDIEKTKTGAIVKLVFSKREFNFTIQDTCIDKSNGITSLLNGSSTIFNLSDFSGLRYKWYKEAFHSTFSTPGVKQTENKEPGEAASDLGKKGFIERIYFILNHKYLRTTYFSAYVYRFLVFIRFYR